LADTASRIDDAGGAEGAKAQPPIATGDAQAIASNAFVRSDMVALLLLFVDRLSTDSPSEPAWLVVKFQKNGLEPG